MNGYLCDFHRILPIGRARKKKCLKVVKGDLKSMDFEFLLFHFLANR